MEEKKRATIYRQLWMYIIAVNVALLFLMFIGYSTAENILSSDNPGRYLNNYKIFCGVVVVVFAVVFTILDSKLLKKIRMGFSLITDVTREMAEGNLDINLPKDRNDEFGELFSEYQKLIDASKKQAILANEVANENLTVEIEPRSKKDKLGMALKIMVDKTNMSLNSIRNASYRVAQSSDEVAKESQSLAQSSTEQASAIEEITASVAEITEQTEHNAKKANQASSLTEQVLNSVNEGNGQMKEMMVAMTEISDSSKNIAKVIKVIDDIAFQTNILALNAAVEAARAGKAGKGFAVVAEEVRNLAEKCAQAAAETAEMIESAIKKIESGSAIANGTMEMFVEIADSVKESTALISNIAEASNNQTATMIQIDKAIDQVSQAIMINSSISEKCSNASMKLEGEATKMADLISQYHLK